MIGFWISAGAMGVMVAVVLLQALRQARTSDLPAGAQDLAIYRDQLAEVDRDLARGVIPPDEAGRLRIEVQRRILDLDRKGQPGLAARPSDPAKVAGLVALALAGAGGLYAVLGAPGYPDLPIAERLAN
ncbi:MAG: c-type cytochrome biogenesis protein CcmI, partial [Rhodobacterales bacterium 17-64-5]